MSERNACQACARTSPNAYLCPTCQHELKDLLTGLAAGTFTNHQTGEQRPGPGQLEYLQDAAWGRTRLGESARRSTERNTPLPVNLGASQLLEDVNHTLQNWVGHLFKKIGLPL